MLLALVKFIYTDEVEAKGLTLDLLAAADKYDVKALFYKIELYNNLSIKNAADNFLGAYQHVQAKNLINVKTLPIHEANKKVMYFLLPFSVNSHYFLHVYKLLQDHIYSLLIFRNLNKYIQDKLKKKDL